MLGMSDASTNTSLTEMSQGMTALTSWGLCYTCQGGCTSKAASLEGFPASHSSHGTDTASRGLLRHRKDENLPSRSHADSFRAPCWH